MWPPPLNHAPSLDIYPVNSQDKVVSVQDIFPLWLTEKNAIEQAIEACDGNIPKAAGYLDVSPSTIYRKLQAWNNREVS